MVGTFQYVVWRDRDFGRLFGPKRVRTGTTAMDPDDPRSLNEAIASAALQNQGVDADMSLYWMDVFAADGTLVISHYRWSKWLDSADDGSYYG